MTDRRRRPLPIRTVRGVARPTAGPFSMTPADAERASHRGIGTGVRVVTAFARSWRSGWSPSLMRGPTTRKDGSCWKPGAGAESYPDIVVSGIILLTRQARPRVGQTLTGGITTERTVILASTPRRIPLPSPERAIRAGAIPGRISAKSYTLRPDRDGDNRTSVIRKRVVLTERVCPIHSD